MSHRLHGTRIALLIEEGFSAQEVNEPLRLLTGEGADVVIVGPHTKAPYRDKTGTVEVAATLSAGAVRAKDIDAVVIPGGYAPDRIRMRHAMVDLVRDAVAAGKPVAAVCHGPQVLISADVVRGRNVTCWPSIAIDVKNAGGQYVDRPAVTDGPVITARKSADIPFLVEALIVALESARNEHSHS
jgi:protease I